MSVKQGRQYRPLSSVASSFQRLATTELEALPPLNRKKLRKIFVAVVGCAAVSTCMTLYGIVNHDTECIYSGLIFTCCIFLGFLYQSI